MMSERVFVTGLGIISGIGLNLQETIDSLLSSRSGIAKAQYLNTPLKDEIPVSEVKLTDRDLFKLAEITDQAGYSRNSLLGMIAAKEAYSSARLHRLTQGRTGLISATTVGGMDQCELYYDDFLRNDSKNAYIDVYDCADSTEKIADLLHIRDYVTTVSTACSSAANAILFGTRLIKSGFLDRVIAGGTESLTKFHLNGFNSLKILSRLGCKPFDAERDGITLGEGAAYVILESERFARDGNRELFAEIAGYGNSCEAFHQTASAPDGTGAYLAMRQALDKSGLGPDDVGYINAHGTGTDNNDLSEGIAIERLFGKMIPYVSSTKPFTGHMTSAAGSAEAILSILCLKYGMILPNLNFRTPMPEISFTPVTHLIEHINLRVVLSNSFGFGGNDTSLLLKKTEI